MADPNIINQDATKTSTFDKSLRTDDIAGARPRKKIQIIRDTYDKVYRYDPKPTPQIKPPGHGQTNRNFILDLSDIEKSRPAKRACVQPRNIVTNPLCPIYQYPGHSQDYSVEPERPSPWFHKHYSNGCGGGGNNTIQESKKSKSQSKDDNENQHQTMSLSTVDKSKDYMWQKGHKDMTHETYAKFAVLHEKMSRSCSPEWRRKPDGKEWIQKEWRRGSKTFQRMKEMEQDFDFDLDLYQVDCTTIYMTPRRPPEDLPRPEHYPPSYYDKNSFNFNPPEQTQIQSQSQCQQNLKVNEGKRLKAKRPEFIDMSLRTSDINCIRSPGPKGVSMKDRRTDEINLGSPNPTTTQIDIEGAISRPYSSDVLRNVTMKKERLPQQISSPKYEFDYMKKNSIGLSDKLIAGQPMRWQDDPVYYEYQDANKQLMGLKERHKGEYKVGQGGREQGNSNTITQNITSNTSVINQDLVSPQKKHQQNQQSLNIRGSEDQVPSESYANKLSNGEVNKTVIKDKMQSNCLNTINDLNNVTTVTGNSVVSVVAQQQQPLSPAKENTSTGKISNLYTTLTPRSAATTIIKEITPRNGILESSSKRPDNKTSNDQNLPHHGNIVQGFHHVATVDKCKKSQQAADKSKSQQQQAANSNSGVIEQFATLLKEESDKLKYNQQEAQSIKGKLLNQQRPDCAEVLAIENAKLTERLFGISHQEILEKQGYTTVNRGRDKSPSRATFEMEIKDIDAVQGKNTGQTSKPITNINKESVSVNNNNIDIQGVESRGDSSTVQDGSIDGDNLVQQQVDTVSDKNNNSAAVKKKSEFNYSIIPNIGTRARINMSNNGQNHQYPDCDTFFFDNQCTPPWRPDWMRINNNVFGAGTQADKNFDPSEFIPAWAKSKKQLQYKRLKLKEKLLHGNKQCQVLGAAGSDEISAQQQRESNSLNSVQMDLSLQNYDDLTQQERALMVRRAENHDKKKQCQERIRTGQSGVGTGHQNNNGKNMYSNGNKNINGQKQYNGSSSPRSSAANNNMNQIQNLKQDTKYEGGLKNCYRSLSEHGPAIFPWERENYISNRDTTKQHPNSKEKSKMFLGHNNSVFYENSDNHYGAGPGNQDIYSQCQLQEGLNQQYRQEQVHGQRSNVCRNENRIELMPQKPAGSRPNANRNSKNGTKYQRPHTVGSAGVKYNGRKITTGPSMSAQNAGVVVQNSTNSRPPSAPGPITSYRPTSSYSHQRAVQLAEQAYCDEKSAGYYGGGSKQVIDNRHKRINPEITRGNGVSLPNSDQQRDCQQPETIDVSRPSSAVQGNKKMYINPKKGQIRSNVPVGIGGLVHQTGIVSTSSDQNDNLNGVPNYINSNIQNLDMISDQGNPNWGQQTLLLPCGGVALTHTAISPRPSSGRSPRGPGPHGGNIRVYDNRIIAENQNHINSSSNNNIQASHSPRNNNYDLHLNHNEQYYIDDDAGNYGSRPGSRPVSQGIGAKDYRYDGNKYRYENSNNINYEEPGHTSGPGGAKLTILHKRNIESDNSKNDKADGISSSPTRIVSSGFPGRYLGAQKSNTSSHNNAGPGLSSLIISPQPQSQQSGKMKKGSPQSPIVLQNNSKSHGVMWPSGQGNFTEKPNMIDAQNDIKENPTLLKEPMAMNDNVDSPVKTTLMAGSNVTKFYGTPKFSSSPQKVVLSNHNSSKTSQIPTRSKNGELLKVQPNNDRNDRSQYPNEAQLIAETASIKTIVRGSPRPKGKNGGGGGITTNGSSNAQKFDQMLMKMT